MSEVIHSVKAVQRAAALTLLVPIVLCARTVTWTGAGANTDWSAAANWSGNTVPSMSDSVVFDATSNKSCGTDIHDTILSLTLTPSYTGTFTFADNGLHILQNVDLRSGGGIIVSKGYLDFCGAAQQQFIPKAGTLAPDIYKTGASTVTVALNSLTGGALWFSAGVWDWGTVTNHSLSFFKSYSNTTEMRLESDTLVITGDAKFDSLASLSSSGGAIIFSDTGRQEIWTKAQIRLPSVIKTGTGLYTVSQGSFNAAGLRIEGGRWRFGYWGATTRHTVDVLSFGGPHDTIDFTGDTVATVSVPDFTPCDTVIGSVGKLELNILTPSTIGSNAKGVLPAIIKKGPSTLTVSGDRFLCTGLNVAEGTFDFGKSSYNQVGFFYGSSQGSVVLDTGNLRILGDADMSGFSQLSWGKASVEFADDSSIQTYTPRANDTLNAVVESGAYQLWMDGNLLCRSFTQTAGKLVFNGFNAATTGDFTVRNGYSNSLAHLDGQTITVGGTASLNGISIDSMLDLGASSTCYINAKSGLHALFANINNLDASSGMQGIADSCRDLGKNVNWDFGAPQAPRIISPPVAINSKEGDTIQFSVVATGNPVPTFQWERNGVGVPDGTSRIYEKEGVAGSDSGYYRCVVKNASGADSSQAVFLSVPVRIPDGTNVHPESVTLCALNNPFTHNTTFVITLPVAAPLDLVAYDCRGRVVARLYNGHQTLGPGSHRVVWNGNDLLGRPAVPGVYLVQAVVGRSSKELTITRLR